MIWDSAEPGFGVDVLPSGRRSWILFYRVHGVQRRIKLGSVDEIPPDLARKRARAAKVVAGDGRDPLKERRALHARAEDDRRALSEASTFTDMADRYVETLEAKRSARWAAEARRILDRDILPHLGRLGVAAVSVPDVERLHERMRDRPFLANRAKAIVSAVLEKARLHGARPRDAMNPAQIVENYPEPPRERILTAAEWRALSKAWAALRAELQDSPAWDTRLAQLDALQLIALTGSRIGAVTARRVSEVDLEARVVRVDPTHKHVSRLFLGAAAAELAMRLVRGRSSAAYLFPGQERHTGARTGRGSRDKRPRRAPAPVSGVVNAWARLRELAGLEDFTPEDFRSCFATIGAELGFSTFVVGGVLGHAAQGVTERHYTARPDELLLRCADAVSLEVARRLQLDQPALRVVRAARA